MPTITVAHSPDSDDAFMHYALARHKIDTGDIEFKHVLQDIETLNQRAATGAYEVTAVSIHAYAYLSDKYALLAHGSSMGENYGPMIVARKAFSAEEIKSQNVAIPGKLTSAYLALKLFAPEIETTIMPFDKILPAVAEGRVAAGVLIHEGQLTYGDAGLHKIIDFGVWWGHETGGLPLPLGGNAIRRDLEPELSRRVSHLLRESIRYALDHREEALDYALEFAREMETRRHLADRFVGMYVNARTLDYGLDGRRAVQLFLDKGVEKGIIPHKVDVEFVD
ncbi:MAG TPA: MqnA/MqnD/SBP family protein [Abditibacteriaceae bacterium]|nr:MqnA/MqnD/SBP family protein [Abditibacteriaceae bacterium]